MTTDTTSRPINPYDVSEDALYVHDKWREPFAFLRRECRCRGGPKAPSAPIGRR